MMAERKRTPFPGFAPPQPGPDPSFIERVMKLPVFINGNRVERTFLLQDAGLSPADASQRAIEFGQREAGGPSVVDRIGPVRQFARPFESFAPSTEENFPGRIVPSLAEEQRFGPQGILTRLGRGARDILVEGGPATAGSIVGAITAPLVRVPRPVGEAFGGMAGEFARQALTSAPFNLEQVFAAGIIPGPAGKGTQFLRGRFPAGRGNVGQMDISPRRMQQMGQFVPGTAGAFSDIAQEAVGEIPSRIRGAIPGLTGTVESSGTLIEQGLQSGGRVPLQNTQQALKALELDLPQGFPLSDIRPELLNPMSDLVEIARNVDLGQGLDIRQFNAVRRFVGEKFGALRAGPQKDALRRLTAGILQDLDDAVTRGLPGAEDLRQGLNVARLEFAADDFEELLETTGLGVVRQGERNPTFRLNRVLTELEKVRRGRPSRQMELFAGAFKGPQGQQELEDIIDLVADLNETVIVMPPPRGQSVGSSQGLAAGAGAIAIGQAVGVPPAIAATAGITTRAILNRLLMSKMGRAALREALTEGTSIDLIKTTGIFLGNLAQQELLQSNPVSGGLQDVRERLTANER